MGIIDDLLDCIEVGDKEGAEMLALKIESEWKPKKKKLGAMTKEEGIAASESTASPAWKAEADRSILRLAAKGEPFAMDHFWKDMHARRIPDPPNKQAVSGRLRRAKAKGWIIPAGGTHQSTEPDQHGSYQTLWIGTESGRAEAIRRAQEEAA